MTFEELRIEAKKQGYNLTPIRKYERLKPCKCGRKYATLWILGGYNPDGDRFYKCPYCGLKGPIGRNGEDAKRKWNKFVGEEI